MRGIACLLTLVGLATTVSTGQEGGDVTLREVKYDGLKDVILKNRGKVVYVDFWNND